MGILPAGTESLSKLLLASGIGRKASRLGFRAVKWDNPEGRHSRWNRALRTRLSGPGAPHPRVGGVVAVVAVQSTRRRARAVPAQRRTVRGGHGSDRHSVSDPDPGQQRVGRGKGQHAVLVIGQG